MNTKIVEFILRVEADDEGVSIKLFNEEDEMEYDDIPEYDIEATSVTESGTIQYYHTLNTRSDFKYVVKNKSSQ